MDTKSTSKNEQLKPGIFRRMISSIGRRIAGVLSRNFESLSLHKKKAVTICFGIVVTLLSGGIILRPFLKDASALSGMLPTQIELPQVHNIPDETFSEADYLLLMRFKRTLDSLRKYDPQVYHQMVQGREGLLDSIDYLVDIYSKLKE